jgi:hypothetical protein
MTLRAHDNSISGPAASAGYDGVLAVAICRALCPSSGADSILDSVSRSITGGLARTSLPTLHFRKGQRQTVLICPETGAGRPDIGLGASGGGGGGSGHIRPAMGFRLAA